MNVSDQDEVPNTTELENNPVGSKPHPEDRDWFLCDLVNFVNDFGGYFNVTLNVGGTIVSGSIVGGADYFKGVADEMTKHVKDPETKENMHLFYAKYADFYPERKVDAEGSALDPEREIPTPIFIHLRNAKFFANGHPPIPGNKGVWWRGKISSVDGFNMGILEPSTNS